MSGPGRLAIAGTFALLTLVWGTTWAAIRIGLEGIPPFTGVALRFLLAASVLFLLSPLMGVRYGRSAVEWRLWGWLERTLGMLADSRQSPTTPGYPWRP